MFPEIDLDISELSESVKNESESLGKVPLFDFDKKSYVLEAGRLVYANDTQALEQWVKFLILNELDKYNIYKGTGFGIKSAYELIGFKEVPRGFLESNLKLELEEKIKMHKYVDRVYNFEFSRSKDLLTINFSIDSKVGTIQSEVIL